MLFLFPGSFSNSYVYFYIVIFVCLKVHAIIRSTNLRFKNVQNQSLGVFQESCKRKRWRCPSHDFLDPFKFFFLRLCDLWQRKTYSFRRVCVAEIGYFSKISTSFGDKIKKKLGIVSLEKRSVCHLLLPTKVVSEESLKSSTPD